MYKPTSVVNKSYKSSTSSEANELKALNDSNKMNFFKNFEYNQELRYFGYLICVCLILVLLMFDISERVKRSDVFVYQTIVQNVSTEDNLLNLKNSTSNLNHIVKSFLKELLKRTKNNGTIISS
jgi:hypothetical protein